MAENVGDIEYVIKADTAQLYCVRNKRGTSVTITWILGLEG